MTEARKRYVVIREPGSGPPALIGQPNDFATEAEAYARIGEIEAGHLKAHHTHLSVIPYHGDLQQALAEFGILF